MTLLSCVPLILTLLTINIAQCEVIELTGSNFQSTIASHDMVFVNFYANWCRFSQMLKPIFQDASKEFEDMKGKVAFASLDADKYSDIASQYNVNKYPTLKLFRFGIVKKSEYRGARSVEAIKEFIDKERNLELKSFVNKAALDAAYNADKPTIFGYFHDKTGEEYDNFMKSATLLNKDCDYLLGIGENNFPGMVPPKIVFKPSTSLKDSVEVTYEGNGKNFEEMREWIRKMCTPVVREITFHNGEELTEEGLPFLLLFKHKDDKMSEKLFKDAVIRELGDSRIVNPLIADGEVFSHPLYHLGKTVQDLPVIAIDSFRHMYVFKDFKDISINGKLSQFVADLQSGKLHREFHHGPDPTQPDANPELTEAPKSVFEKLKPSENRYSLLKTEL